MTDNQEFNAETRQSEEKQAIKPESGAGIDRGDGRDCFGRLVRGVSGNPTGRPKKNHITEAFEEMLEEKMADPEARQAFKEAHWKKLLSNTVVSSMTLEKILDRTEGKVSQPVQVSGELSVSLSDEIRKARERAEGPQE